MTSRTHPRLLSVVIPTHDDPQCLELTCASLTRQTLERSKFEIVIVDDGSKQPVAEALAGALTDLPVRHVRLEPNRGRAAARNAGIRAASGQTVLFLDSDSFADSRLLEQHYEFHADARGNQVLAGRRYEINWQALAQLRDSGSVRPASLGIAEEDLRAAFWVLPEFKRAWQMAPWLYAYTHNISAPKALLEAAGLFDEEMTGWGHEDIDLAFRLFRACGQKEDAFVLGREAICYHVPHFRDGQSNRQGAERNARHLRNKYRSLELELLGREPYMVLAHKFAYYRRVFEHCRLNGLGYFGDLESSLKVPGRSLRFGLHAPGATLAASEVYCDYAREVGPNNFHVLGVKTDFEDGRFASVVNFDLWRFMYWNDLCAFVSESLRISKRLCLGFSKNPKQSLELREQFHFVDDIEFIRRTLIHSHRVEVADLSQDLGLLEITPLQRQDLR